MITYFSSESVTCGHPDKVCDQIADAILDEILARDAGAHVACEVTAMTDEVHIFGEITTTASVDYEKVARDVIRGIGYTEPGHGFDADTCRVDVDIHTQSPDIAQGVNRHDECDAGAGDQGMMFGYACDETEEFMPLPITLAHALTRRLEYVRRRGIVPDLLPDGKAQVTVQYEDGKAKRVSTVVVSTQHEDGVDIDALRDRIVEKVIRAAIPAELLDDGTLFYINPTGRFVIGGPAGDTGLTGRKIIVDTYGGTARHGGGSFSGKDASKVDRSGAYMARYIAKNIVKAGLASKCEVQLSYAIGLSEPVSVFVDTFGTGKISSERIAGWVVKHIDMRPAMITKRFGLRRPIYHAISCYGHFGENAKDMPWEKTDVAAEMRSGLVAKVG